MHYDVSKILTLGSVQCSLIIAFLYMIPLNKREKFAVKFLLGTFFSLVMVPLLRMYQSYTAGIFQSGSTAQRFWGTILGVGGDLSLNLLLISVVVFFCCNIKMHKALYCGVCAYLTQDIAYTIFVIIMPDAANRGKNPGRPDTLWLEVVIFILVSTFFYFFFARKLPENGDYAFHCARSLPAMLIIMYIARILGAYAKRTFDVQNNHIFEFMLVYDVLLSVTLLVTQLLQRGEEKYRTAAVLEKQLRLTQKRQYEMFRENQESMNHKCHDLKHLVAALQGETDSARKKELYEELQENLMIYDARMNTGNDVLDALLAEAWMNCYHRNVQWTCMADGSGVKFLNPIDLYTLLGNALENAIESAAENSNVQKRFLSVNIWKKERMAFIKIENYCEHMPEFRNGLPVTTKQNPQEHGYGMQSIQSVIRHYNGELKISVADHIFTLDVILPIPMDIC